MTGCRRSKKGPQLQCGNPYRRMSLIGRKAPSLQGAVMLHGWSQGNAGPPERPGLKAIYLRVRVLNLPVPASIPLPSNSRPPAIGL